jgi:F0F1-type ATP synthase membrane subunit c/vacuolar-type H+-ATPase subunit K
MNDPDDPGWAPALRRLRLMFIPFAGPFLVKRERRVDDGLITLRLIFLSLIAAVFLYVVALFFISSGAGRHQTWVIYWVAGSGPTSAVIVEFVTKRPLALESERTLQRSFFNRMFAGIGIAESPALFGVVGTFIYGSVWVYVLGAAFALIGPRRIAPGPGNLAREQERITASNSSLSLVAALRLGPPPRRGTGEAQ